MASRDVVRHLDVEAFGLEKGQAAGIAVDAIEDLIDQRLVADEPRAWPLGLATNGSVGIP